MMQLTQLNFISQQFMLEGQINACGTTQQNKEQSDHTV